MKAGIRLIVTGILLAAVCYAWLLIILVQGPKGA